GAGRVRSADSVLTAASSGKRSAVDRLGESTVPRKRVFLPALVAAGLALIAGIAVGMFLLQRPAQTSLPVYHPLTFRRGIVHSARFAPDGKTIIYSAAWEGKPLELFTTRPESPESQELRPAGADVLDNSASGELARSLGSHPTAPSLSH